MDVLFFFTDRFPYGKGEAFIENEVPFLEKRFDRIYVIPTALTADVTTQRSLSEKFVVLPPANTDNLYAMGRPSNWQRVKWSLKYMIPWCACAFFTKDFWQETRHLLQTSQLRPNTLAALIRVVAPTRRNENHFKKIFKAYQLPISDNYYLYSYWFNNYPCSLESITGIGAKELKSRIMRSHRIDLYEEMHACCYIPLRQKSFKALDKLVLISDDGYRYITDRYPEYKEKCAVSRLGTKDYGVGPYSDRNPFVLVSCSYVIPVKRVHRIVDALSLIHNNRIHWIHFGAGQDYDQLKQYATDKLKDNNKISFELKGQFLNKDLMVYYQNHPVSLFVNVSKSEGLPVSIMEATSFGIPVLATNVGGTSETFRDVNDGALLAEDFNDNELSEQIMRFVTMEEKTYTEKRLETRNIWKERFDASRNYQQFISSYFK